LLCVGVLVCEALFSLLAVSLLPKFGPVRVSAYITSIAVPILTIAGLAGSGTAFLRMPTTTEALCIAFLGLPLTVGAFVLWYRCLQSLGADRAGLLIGIVPIAATISGAAFGDGLPSAPRLLGIVVVAAGAVFGLASPSTLQGVRDRVLGLVERKNGPAGQGDGGEDSPTLLTHVEELDALRG
jgi:drug/metabolite transporter (DMT)-like permease